MAEDIYARIRTAAFELLAEGIWPTVVEVRARLGSGSNTTINNTLKLWRQEFLAKMATSARRPDLPLALSEAFEVVWQQACEHAENALDAMRAEIVTERVQLQTQLQTAQQLAENRLTLLTEQAQALELGEKRLAETASALQTETQARQQQQELYKQLAEKLSHAEAKIIATETQMTAKLLEAEEETKRQLQEVRAEAEKREALAYERLEGLRIRLYEQIEEERKQMQQERQRQENETQQARQETARIEALWQERLAGREREIGHIKAKLEGLTERRDELEAALQAEKEQGRAVSEKVLQLSGDLAQAHGAVAAQEERIVARLTMLVTTQGETLSLLTEAERYDYLHKALIG
ncbi:DNA-binding protein [Aquitalea sp. S1-19]|nr:DNA-binding protein [Aquitalea sp. S1-19]